MPERFRLQRTKGYRKPEGGISCARPTKWGNPFVPGRLVSVQDMIFSEREAVLVVPNLTASLALYRSWVLATFGLDRIRAELGGRDLGCYCALDDPCHVDVLLALANPGVPAAELTHLVSANHYTAPELYEALAFAVADDEELGAAVDAFIHSRRVQRSDRGR